MFSIRMSLNVNVDHVEPFLQDPLISMPWNNPFLRIPPSLSLHAPPACPFSSRVHPLSIRVQRQALKAHHCQRVIRVITSSHPTYIISKHHSHTLSSRSIYIIITATITGDIGDIGDIGDLIRT